MAFTAYRSWISGETLTAALMNEQIRDNGNLTPAALATTKGDTFVATAANAVTRLGVGSNSRVLVADSSAATGVRWSNTGLTASAGAAVGLILGTTLTASANSNALYQMSTASSVYATGTYTGLSAISIAVTAATKTGTGTIDNCYGIYVEAPTVGTTNWPLYIDGGNTRLGTGITYINDTSNANMTTGLTINQGAADDEIVALKSSDVAHGMTGQAETDTYGVAKKITANGGLAIYGYASYTTGQAMGVQIEGESYTADATKNAGSIGSVTVSGFKKSGTSVTTLGATENIMTISSGATRFIFQADGSAYEDVGTAFTNFDTHDDIELLNLLSAHVTRKEDPIRKSFGKWLKEKRSILEKLKLVKFNRDGHHFINRSRTQELLIGAMRQQAARWEETAERLAQLETRLLKAGV